MQLHRYGQSSVLIGQTNTGDLKVKSLFVILALKVLTFLGTTLNTIGFLTFFFWRSLEPYRWHMILIGLVLIAASELSLYFLLKRMKNETNA